MSAFEFCLNTSLIITHYAVQRIDINYFLKKTFLFQSHTHTQDSYCNCIAMHGLLVALPYTQGNICSEEASLLKKVDMWVIRVLVWYSQPLPSIFGLKNSSIKKIRLEWRLHPTHSMPSCWEKNTVCCHSLSLYVWSFKWLRNILFTFYRNY